MKWLGDGLVAGKHRFEKLPPVARRWLTLLAVPALAMGTMIGTLLGPGFIGATGLPAVPGVPVLSSSSGEGDLPDVVASAGGSPPALGAPSGNVAPPPPPAAAPATSFVPLTPTPEVPATPDPAPAGDDPATDQDPAEPPPKQPDPMPADQPDGPTLTGTVVRVNPVARSYALTQGEDSLVAIHAAKLPDPGTTVKVHTRELSNGTYAEDGKRRLTGKAATATFSGIVTYADAVTGAYSVSARGASVLVHPAREGSKPPPVGSQLKVSVEIQAADPAPETDLGQAPLLEPPPAAVSLCTKPKDAFAPDPPVKPAFILVERSEKADKELLGYSNLEGVVQAVCSSPAKLVISSDDVREAGADLRLIIPKDLDLSAVEPGTAVNVTTLIDEKTGALEMSGLSSDQGARGANDADAALGDQSGG